MTGPSGDPRLYEHHCHEHPDHDLSILIVDDHRILADVLALRLEADDRVGRVDEVTTLAAARAMAHTVRHDIVLLDLDLDGICGLDLLPDLEEAGARPRVIVLSGSKQTSDILAALRAGVEGWSDEDDRCRRRSRKPGTASRIISCAARRPLVVVHSPLLRTPLSRSDDAARTLW